MIYRQDKKQNIKKVFFVWIIIFTLTYVVLFTQVFNIISKGVNLIAVPVWEAQNTIFNIWSNLSIEFISKSNLQSENENLKEKLKIANVKLLDRDLLYDENIKLKGLFGRQVVSNTSIFASVLTKPNRTPYDTVIIDVGKNKGVKKNDKVFYGDNIIIGKVMQVFSNSSKVLLLSSYGEKVDVVIGDNSISAVAYGRGGGNFELKLPRDTKVSIGDIVSVPSMDIRVLGVVEYIRSKPSDPFKVIIFKGPIDIFKLKWVKVATNGV